MISLPLLLFTLDFVIFQSDPELQITLERLSETVLFQLYKGIIDHPSDV